MLSLMLLSGCEHEYALSGHINEEDMSSEKVRIEIFTRANSYKLPTTRGVADEGTVGKTPWVFVFKGTGADATFVEAVQAFESVKKRYVTLTRQTDGSKYQLLIIANPPIKFYYGDNATEYGFDATGFSANLIQDSTTLSDVCMNMLTEPLANPALPVIPYSADGETIPMSYLLEVDKIDHTTKIEDDNGDSLMLIRSIAKIMIINKAANFELEGITAVANVPRQGRFHNLDGSVMDNLLNLTEYRYDATYSSPVVRAEVIAGGQSTETAPVYLYESDIRNGTYLIIRGIYEGRSYYYKMAVVDDYIQPMDLLRNHLYTFTITTAKGPGYDTVEDAKASKASNTALDYKIWIDDSDSYEVIANNDFFLGVSNSVFIAYTSSGSADFEVFNFVTDCRTYFPSSCHISDNRDEVGTWSFQLLSPQNGERIPIVDDTTPDPNITPVEARISNWLLWHEDYQYDEHGVPRNNAYITLKLGNLEKKVRIRQRYAIPAAGTIIKYMPTADSPDSFDMNYYCLSAYVEEGADNARSWIKLRPASGVSREDTDSITVDDGKIYIEVGVNVESSSRTGVIYLTTIKDPHVYPSSNSMRRIKISITQLGKE